MDNSATENLTTCTICLETLKTPKYFPCLHSFCEGCIKTYITTTFAQETCGVSCPVCRIFIKKPNHFSIEEWADKLPTNHILVSLIDVKETKLGQRFCTACARENETESAHSWCINCSETLCETCDRSHRRSKVSSNHKLIELTEDLSTEIPLHHADVFCTKHPDEKVKAYCSDHTTVCCTTCVMLKHRKCENVGSIEEAVEEIKKSKEKEEFLENLQDLKKTLETFCNERSENLHKFEYDIKKIRSNVECLFREVTEHLIELKNNTMLEISRVESEIRPSIENNHFEIKCRISSVENNIALFQTNMRHAPPAHFMQAMEKLSEQKCVLEDYANDLKKKLTEIKVYFEANEKLLEMGMTVREFGKVIVSGTTNNDIERRAESERKTYIEKTSLTLEEKEKQNVNRTVHDDLQHKDTCTSNLLMKFPTVASKVNTAFRITGIALLTNDHVVLSNYDNMMLELRDPHRFKILSSITLPGCPYGIKLTSDTEGAVAVGGHGLVIFSIRKNEIVIDKKIKSYVHHDFVFYREKYYVGCNKKISVYDRGGRHIRNRPMENTALYMTVYDGKYLWLCYTVLGGHELYCITMGGIHVFTYTHDKLQGTTGVTVDHGFIYVCGGWSRNVHQLSHDGKLQRIMCDNLSAAPWSICFNTEADKAVIGCEGKILLYDLK